MSDIINKEKYDYVKPIEEPEQVSSKNLFSSFFCP